MRRARSPYDDLPGPEPIEPLLEAAGYRSARRRGMHRLEADRLFGFADVHRGYVAHFDLCFQVGARRRFLGVAALAHHLWTDNYSDEQGATEPERVLLVDADARAALRALAAGDVLASSNADGDFIMRVPLAVDAGEVEYRTRKPSRHAFAPGELERLHEVGPVDIRTIARRGSFLGEPGWPRVR